MSSPSASPPKRQYAILQNTRRRCVAKSCGAGQSRLGFHGGLHVRKAVRNLPYLIRNRAFLGAKPTSNLVRNSRSVRSVFPCYCQTYRTLCLDVARRLPISCRAAVGSWDREQGVAHAGISRRKRSTGDSSHHGSMRSPSLHLPPQTYGPIIEMDHHLSLSSASENRPIVATDLSQGLPIGRSCQSSGRDG